MTPTGSNLPKASKLKASQSAAPSGSDTLVHSAAPSGSDAVADATDSPGKRRRGSSRSSKSTKTVKAPKPAKTSRPSKSSKPKKAPPTDPASVQASASTSHAPVVSSQTETSVSRAPPPGASLTPATASVSSNSPGVTQFTIADADNFTTSLTTSSFVPVNNTALVSNQPNPLACPAFVSQDGGNVSVPTANPIFSVGQSGVLQNFSINPDGTLTVPANLPSSSGVVHSLVLNSMGQSTSSASSPGFVLVQAPPTAMTAQGSLAPPQVVDESSTTAVPDNTEVLPQQQVQKQSTLPQDSVGPERGRSRSRSSQPGRSRRRRHSSSSSDRSPRRKRRPVQEQPNSQLLSQILGMLSSLPQFSQDIDQPSTSGVPPRASAPNPHFLSDDSVDSEPETSHPQRKELPPEGEEPIFSEEYDSEEEEQPLFGTDIPRESFEKAVEVLRRQLGFLPEDVPECSSSKSKLTLNAPVASSRASLPVDAECADRFRALPSGSSGRKWTAYSKTQNVSFRVEDKDWRDLFKTPAIPQGAEDYLRSVGALGQGAKLKSQAARKALRSLYQVDTASRVGLKFASSLLLIAEVLSKSFRQASSSEVSRRDTSILVSLLGPISRRVFDQFARVSVKTVADRRDLIIDAMNLSQENVKRRFRDLPILGQDIFAGQFETVLQDEAKRKKDLLKANLSSSRSFQTRAFSRRSPQSRPSRAPRTVRRQPAPRSSNRQSYQSSRPRLQLPPQQPRFRPRGSSRGSSSSGRGRGFSRP